MKITLPIDDKKISAIAIFFSKKLELALDLTIFQRLEANLNFENK